jgi:hypothetical protein
MAITCTLHHVLHLHVRFAQSHIAHMKAILFRRAASSPSIVEDQPVDDVGARRSTLTWLCWSRGRQNRRSNPLGSLPPYSPALRNPPFRGVTTQPPPPIIPDALTLVTWTGESALCPLRLPVLKARTTTSANPSRWSRNQCGVVEQRSSGAVEQRSSGAAMQGGAAKQEEAEQLEGRGHTGENTALYCAGRYCRENTERADTESREREKVMGERGGRGGLPCEASCALKAGSCFSARGTISKSNSIAACCFGNWRTRMLWLF